jgi:pyridoxal/pyridoxine/pyridoxamine kinase
MQELVANMDPVIAKPDKLFREKEISRLYKKFSV